MLGSSRERLGGSPQRHCGVEEFYADQSATWHYMKVTSHMRATGHMPHHILLCAIGHQHLASGDNKPADSFKSHFSVLSTSSCTCPNDNKYITMPRYHINSPGQTVLYQSYKLQAMGRSPANWNVPLRPQGTRMTKSYKGFSFVIVHSC